MRDEHVIKILEGAPLARLGEGELQAVRAHAARCDECRRAYEAAQVSSLLIKRRAAEAFEPPPFFQTRVLAALRERRGASEVPALRRMWRAAGALVSSMAAAVVVLGALSFTAPAARQTAQAESRALNPYTEEAVLLAQDEQSDEEANAARVLAAVYGPEEEAEGDYGQDY